MELFKHTGFAPEITDIDWLQVPGIIRVLLTTDGTVTKSLEAYFWEPVAVKRTGQQTLAADLPESSRFAGNLPVCESLNARALWRRDVNLVGEKTGNIYASATSLIDPASLPSAIAEGLAAGKLGIGGVIRELGLETYRQVVGVGQSAPDTLWRSYRLFYQGDVLMQICETFDLARFKGLGAL